MSVKRFFRRRQWDAERAREIEAHLAHEIDDNVARGMRPDDARAAAYRKFGNPTLVRERIYDLNSIGGLEALLLDFRDARRQLLRRPWSTAVSVLLLGIGIAASTAAFAVWYGVLRRPLAFPDAARLVTIWSDVHGRPGQVSYPDLRDVRGLPIFDSVGAIAGGRGTLIVGSDVDRVTLADVEPSVLPMLGAHAALGRLPGALDAGHMVGAISHRLWTRVFHSDPAILDRTLQISGRSFSIIGVLADDPPFELPVGGADMGIAFTVKDVDVWTPLDPADPLAGNRAVVTYEALARLAPGVTLASAQSAVDNVAAALAAQYADTNRDRGIRLVRLRDQVVGARRSAIRLGAAGALLLLVIACANAISVTLGTLPLRRRDAALRAALGADRARLVRQALWESAILAAVAGAFGLGVALVLIAWVKASVPLPRVDAMRFDAPVLLFSLAAAAASALAARILPLLRLDASPAGLRASVSSHAASAPRFRRLLVAAQLALATMTCAAGALLATSLLAILRIDPGFAPEHALSARVSAYADAHRAKADVVRFYQELLDSLRGEPGITAAGAATSLPLSETNTGTLVMVEGQPLPESERPAAGWQAVTPGYFAAMGMPLRAGRDFTSQDLARSSHHVVINESLARRLFGDASPLGRRIALGPQDDAVDWHEVVGVVGDVRHGDLTQASGPRAYDLFGEHWARTMYLVVRAAPDGPATASLIRDAVRRIDPGAPVFDVRTLDTLVSNASASARTATVFATALGAVSLLLAALGVYGLLASTVAARRRELGICRALGASGLTLARQVAAEALTMSVVGVAGGLFVTAASTRVLQSQLYGVSVTDAAVLAGVTTLLIVTAALAALPPALRAAHADPAAILRID